MSLVKTCQHSRQLKQKIILNECSSRISIRNAASNGKNAFGVSLVSPKLHERLFNTPYKECKDKHLIEEAKQHLEKFNIKANRRSKSNRNAAVDEFDIPPLKQDDIELHFESIASEQIQPFLQQIKKLLDLKEAPQKPLHWAQKAGWTKYDVAKGTSISVPFPHEDVLVFDIEVCVAEARWPAMATAMSPTCWYSWTSEYLLDPSKRPPKNKVLNKQDLIPIGNPLLVIGHNVSFDRSYIAEQYDLSAPQTRFLDTMALHIAVSGMTAGQRLQMMAAKSKKNRTGIEEEPKWMKETSMNSLKDLHQLYYKDAKVMDKDIRNVFVKGTLEDVVDDFANLIRYCGDDVEATFKVFRKVFVKFQKQCPHPVTLSGMLEMSVPYLPTNPSWFQFVKECDNVTEELEEEIDVIIARQAQEACQLMADGEYENDIWLWKLDWNCTKLKMRKIKPLSEKEKQKIGCKDDGNNLSELEKLEQKFWPLLKSKESMYKIQPKIPGYPKWYSDLCEQPYDPMVTSSVDKLGHGKEIVPRLLRLTWNGYPLHKDATRKWGYLVPDLQQNPDELAEYQQNEGEVYFPLKTFWLRTQAQSGSTISKDMTEMTAKNLEIDDPDGRNKFKKKLKSVKVESGFTLGDIDGVLFHPLPHKDGKETVGNPLSKGLLERFQDGTLSTDYDGGQFGGKVLRYSKMMSYWRSNRDRICNQFIVETDAPDNYAILPQIVTAGTLTRRAVEKTWLTASNARPDRIGSELKAMVMASENHTFVGADVDSQELWIAAILGDAYLAKEHGCTALGWRTLQGNKADGTDMHSVTANLSGVSRDEAKILNYARIYGAGKLFAKNLLMQFNPSLNEKKAFAQASNIYTETKGEKVHKLNALGILCYRIAYDQDVTDPNQIKVDAKILKTCSRIGQLLKELLQPNFDPSNPKFELQDGVQIDLILDTEWKDEMKDELSFEEMKKVVRSVDTWRRRKGSYDNNDFVKARKDAEKLCEGTYWKGGSESYTFNHLEELALSWKAKTPILGCAISEALTSENVGTDYLTSRVNWVVQSSAVDYLHLLLSASKWLINRYDIEARFAISIHDEVRYLVSNEDAYRAALALQVANLMVRAMFCKRLNMNSMPLDVAYFSGVDIDKVMRKEPFADCVTPSNPQGLTRGYGVPVGQCLTMNDILEKTHGKLEKSLS